MNDKIHSTMERLTTKNEKENRANLRFLAKQNLLILSEAMKLQKKHFHRLKNGNTEEDIEIISLAALFLAANDVKRALSGKDRKNRDRNLSKLKKIAKFQAHAIKKKRTTKEDQLLNYLGKIRVWSREENLSCRQISENLRKFHRKRFSHTTICVFIKKYIQGVER